MQSGEKYFILMFIELKPYYMLVYAFLRTLRKIFVVEMEASLLQIKENHFPAT